MGLVLGENNSERKKTSSAGGNVEIIKHPKASLSKLKKKFLAHTSQLASFKKMAAVLGSTTHWAGAELQAQMTMQTTAYDD